MRLNLFEKSFNEITIDDIRGLIGKVDEGYYVEYKSKIPEKNLKIARSIASFANTYGGWYFLGIETDEANNAFEISGISSRETADLIDKIRNTIKDNINPIPVFYIRSIELDPDKSVIIVFIPDNQDAPFVTSDGKTYIRIGDSSDRIKESDRYTLDKLYESSKEKRLKFSRFKDDQDEKSPVHNNVGFIKIYIQPYPMNSVSKFNIPMDEDVKALMEKSKNHVKIKLTESGSMSGNVPFTSGHVSFSSIKLDQSSSPITQPRSFACEFFNDGRGKISIPLDIYEGLTFDGINSFKSSEAKTALREKFSSNSNSLLNFRLFDYGKAIASTLILTGYYLDWLGSVEQVSGFNVAIKISNVNNFIPFFDTKEWATHVKEFGLPIISKSNISYPEFDDFNIIGGELSKVEDGLFTGPIYVAAIVGLMLGLPFNKFFHALESFRTT